MKKFIFFFMLTFLWISANSQTATIQTVAGAIPGSNTVVNIMLNGFAPDSIFDFQFTIRFDTTHIRYVNTTNWAAGITGIQTLTTNYGNITAITFLWPSATPVIVNGVLCKLNFIYKTTGVGCTAITWSDTPIARDFVKEGYVPFNVTYTDGAICACAAVQLFGTTAALPLEICSGYGSSNIKIPLINGDLPINYQWQYYNGISWSNVVNGIPAGAVYSHTDSSAMNVGGITNAGTYQYRCYVTNCAGIYSATTNSAFLTVVKRPNTPVLDSVTQPTCTLSTGSVALSGLPATGTWMLTRTPGNINTTGSGTSIILSGLPSSTYSFVVTDLSTLCVSEPLTNVVVNVQPVTPPTPSIGAITQPSCTTSTGSVYIYNLPSGSQIWTITRNPGNVTTPPQSGLNTTITGLPPGGTYVFTVNISTSPCSSAPSGPVIINNQPIVPNIPIVGSITQPTCTTATGAVALSGLPTSSWVVTATPGGATIAGMTSTATFSGLAAGTTYTFTVTLTSSGCTSESSTSAAINAQPVTPMAPIVGTITQPTCLTATGTVALSGLPTTPWTVTAMPGGATIAGSTTTASFSGLAASTTYTFTVTLTSSGCTSAASTSAAINAQPITPTAPIIGTITQPTCLTATGIVALSGLPTTAWTVTAMPGGATIIGSSATASFSGLAASTNYTFTVTLASSGCTSAASTSAAINAQPVTPTAPIVGTITQPTCLAPTGTVALSGLPSTSWTVTAMPGGTTITGSTSTANFSGLAGNTTYSFTVTLTSSGCTSTSSTSAIINASPVVPTAPIVGTITQPTCTTVTGSVALSGLPTTAWIVTASPGGTQISGNVSTALFSGLAANTTYTFSVTLTSSGCTSPASTAATINSQPPTPSAPIVGAITQPTCLIATGSVALSGLPTNPWTITAMPGGAILTGSTATANFSGLAANTTYTFTVTITASGCTSAASTSATINGQPITPSAPIVGTITQPTCSTATGSVFLSGLPTSVWAVTANPGGATISGLTSTATFSGLAANTTYTFTVTLGSSTCTSTSSTSATINPQPLTPSAPIIGAITQPTCTTTTGAVILNGLPTTLWTVVASPGGAILTGSTATASFSGLSPNATYTFTVTLASSGCTSAPSAGATINAQPVVPMAPIIGSVTQPTCTTPTGSVVISGLPSTLWTLVAMPGSIALVGSSPTATFLGLSANTSYTFTVTLASSGCTSAASTVATINAPPVIPSAPIIGVITQPTCTTATGSVVLSGLPTSPWLVTAIPGGATISGTSSSATFSGLSANTNYTFTVTLGSTGCTSAPSSNATINGQPAGPTAPIVGTITQPTCTIATGSVALSGLPNEPWIVTVMPGGATITGSSTTAIFSGLAANTTYTFTVTLASSGCTSGASTSATINSQPETPNIPNQTISINSGQTFTITPSPVPVGTTYTWTAPTYTNGVTGGSAQTNPQTNISGTLTIPSGTGTAVYTVTPSAGPCVGLPFTVTVTVTSVLHITSIMLNNDTVCLGDSIHLGVTVSGGNPPYSFTWSGTGLSDNTLQNPTALPVLGSNTYSVTVTDGTTTIDTTIMVFVSSIQLDSLYFDCETYSATALPLGLLSYEFFVNNVSMQESDMNTYYSSSVANEDSISVIVMDQNGCTASASVIVSCLGDVEFPTAFTPNGDKFNDLFPTDSFSIKKYELKVFDRWGLMLYSGQTGWDGTYKGKLLPPATYYYRVIIKNPNGTETEKIGSITLIKY